MISAFKNWFFRCRCSQDISESERESIFALEILRDEHIISLQEEVERYKKRCESLSRDYVEAMDSLKDKEAMCTQLTHQVENYRLSLINQKKAEKKQTVTQPVQKKKLPVRGHTPECMD